VSIRVGASERARPGEVLRRWVSLRGHRSDVLAVAAGTGVDGVACGPCVDDVVARAGHDEVDSRAGADVVVTPPPRVRRGTSPSEMNDSCVNGIVVLSVASTVMFSGSESAPTAPVR
jgi:hypothetical protein